MILRPCALYRVRGGTVIVRLLLGLLLAMTRSGNDERKMIEDIHKNWKPGDPVGYIRPEIPEFDLPPYRGQRYEALVPDTLDLAERARLAIHGLTEPTDPQADYEVFWHVLFRCHPPMMRHEWPCISLKRSQKCWRLG